MLYLALRLVHIAGMAAWFGAAMFSVGDLRRSLAAGATHLDLLGERLKRTSMVAAISGWVTVLSGLALIFALGGFGSVPVAIHIGMTLAFVNIGMGIATGAQAQKAVAALKAGQDPQPFFKKTAMFGGIAHALWFVILALMVFRTAIG